MSEEPELRNVKISGFKSFGTGENEVDLNLDDINIIIGANGAGKSNIVSFFKMLSKMMAGTFQVYVGKEGSAEHFLHFGSKNTPEIKASLEFSNRHNTDIYEFVLTKAVQDSLVFLSETITCNGSTSELANGHKESFLLSQEAVMPSEKAVRRFLLKCRSFQFHDTSSTSNIRGTARLDNNISLMGDGGNIASFLYMLKNSSQEVQKYYSRIVEKVRLIIPQFADFILEPQPLNKEYIRLQWRSTDDVEYPFGPEQLSDGAIRFIALATLLLQPPELLPSFIVIDEPELGLHPQAVDVLASMIRTASLHSQVIVATQSARLLDSFNPRQIIVAEYEKKGECSVFRRLDEEALEEWLKDFSISELWEKNVLGGQP